MNLTYEQIVSIAQGFVYVEQKEEGIQFHRFTEAQEKAYGGTGFHPKHTTAGVRLQFRTDSKNLYMKILHSEDNGFRLFAHDFLVDGEYIGSLKNSTEDVYGEFEQKFELGEGVKEVCIHFPWSTCSILKELCLEEGSFVEPVKKYKKILVFGDSITQGHDAENPMYRYSANLADALDAEEINKAVSGEMFCPWLVALKDDFEPDYISVAYGTNHWQHSSSEEFRVMCEEFYDKLVENYPNAKVFALTPIWRKDRTNTTQFESFEQIEEIMEDVVKKYDNVTCVSGRHFVPEDETLFSDRFLHPNNKGFKYYSESVTKAVENISV